MALRRHLLVICIYFTWDQYVSGLTCAHGYTKSINGTCIDMNECLTDPCGPKALCHNSEGSFYCTCGKGFYSESGDHLIASQVESHCRDEDECLTNPCGPNAFCHNTEGSFYCTCGRGFYSESGDHSFAGQTESYCRDYNECYTTTIICGSDATCHNTEGSFYCICNKGFAGISGETNYTGYRKRCEDIDECSLNLCGPNANCTNTVGSYTCTCNPGFISTSGGTRLNHSDKCVVFDCPSADFTKCSSVTMETGSVQASESSAEPGHDAGDPFCSVIGFFRDYNVCEKLHSEDGFDSEQHLMNITTLTNELLGNHSLMENMDVQERQNALAVSLQTIENSVMAVAFTLPDQEKKNMSFGNIEVQMEVLRDHNISDAKTVSLSAKGNQMDIHWRAVTAGDDPGFAGVALIAFSQMDSVLNGSLKHEGEHLRLNSHVLTATSTRKNGDALVEPVNITFRNEKERKPRAEVVCVALNRTGIGSRWTRQSCTVVESNATHTVCKCTHLTSFAVLMALYETQDPWHLLNLNLISYIGIIISLVCLFISFVTFLVCRAIQGTRTTIHTHLCLCLFLAELLFLVGISQTSNKIACAIIAGFLHYFFLTVFAWMCLEGTQLYLMVVKVFNAGCLRKRHMFPVGYGLPLLVVGISAAVYREGYGTSKHCWLDLKNHFIWSFLGPVCAIIMINAVFYCITLGKLAKKMSTLKKDKPKLKKIRSFILTAIAQLFLLGCTWIFGIFHFQEETIVMAYIFTIVNSLQGTFIFILHCLLNKQVRDEYRKWFCRICCLKPIIYSEFIMSSSVPMSSLRMRNISTSQERNNSLRTKQ
ncbi:adhesion G protein-coupled receptor E2-like isoform X2 [Heptranchias perlo]|uniref:adhesion G protein-coupled receptor E2-like isoform X2 n=1 Tax=Heptranchias perlo TaxID=212740 RepID=UPI00355951AD